MSMTIRHRNSGMLYQVSADLVQIVHEPVEVQLPTPATLPVTTGLYQQKLAAEATRSLHERRRIGQVMKRIKHHHQVNRASRLEALYVPDGEGHVTEPERLNVRGGTIDASRAMVDTQERRMGTSSRQFARDLAGAASQIKHLPGAAHIRCTQIGKAADGHVAWVRGSERVELLISEQRVVECPVALWRPTLPRGSAVAKQLSESCRQHRGG